MDRLPWKLLKNCYSKTSELTPSLLQRSAQRLLVAFAHISCQFIMGTRALSWPTTHERSLSPIGVCNSKDSNQLDCVASRIHSTICVLFQRFEILSCMCFSLGLVTVVDSLRSQTTLGLYSLGAQHRGSATRLGGRHKREGAAIEEYEHCKCA